MAETGFLPFTKSLRAGGRYEPHIFVHMLSVVIDQLVPEWELLGFGFTLKESGERITNAIWADIHSCLHPIWNSYEQFLFMARTLAIAIQIVTVGS